MRMHRPNSGGDDDGGSDHNRAYYSAHRFEHLVGLLHSKQSATRIHTKAHDGETGSRIECLRILPAAQQGRVCQRVESMLRAAKRCTAKNRQNGQRPYRQRRPPASDSFAGGASTAISHWFRLLYEGGRLY